MGAPPDEGETRDEIDVVAEAVVGNRLPPNSGVPHSGLSQLHSSIVPYCFFYFFRRAFHPRTASRRADGRNGESLSIQFVSFVKSHNMSSDSSSMPSMSTDSSVSLASNFLIKPLTFSIGGSSTTFPTGYDSTTSITSDKAIDAAMVWARMI